MKEVRQTVLYTVKFCVYENSLVAGKGQRAGTEDWLQRDKWKRRKDIIRCYKKQSGCTKKQKKQLAMALPLK